MRLNIVFDLDGTLIDSAPDIQSVASNILCSLGKAALTLDETRSFIGEGAAVFVRRMMTARGIEDTSGKHAELHENFVAQYETALDQAVFYPGVLDALKQGKSVICLSLPGYNLLQPGTALAPWSIGNQTGTAIPAHPAFGDFPNNGYLDQGWFRPVDKAEKLVREALTKAEEKQETMEIANLMGYLEKIQNFRKRRF